MARSKKQEAVAEEDKTLYEQICEATDLSYDEEEGDVEAFKENVARFFADMEDSDFAELPEEVRDWADEAIDVIKANRSKSAKKKSPLPEIDGLPEGAEAEPEEEEEEAKPAKGKKGRASKADAADEKPAKGRKGKASKKGDEKLKGEGRNPENNRYFRISELLIEDPEQDDDELEKAAKDAGYDYSDITLKRGREAFDAVTGALRKHGKLK